jgi:hypothetical protein
MKIEASQFDDNTAETIGGVSSLWKPTQMWGGTREHRVSSVSPEFQVNRARNTSGSTGCVRSLPEPPPMCGATTEHRAPSENPKFQLNWTRIFSGSMGWVSYFQNHCQRVVELQNFGLSSRISNFNSIGPATLVDPRDVSAHFQNHCQRVVTMLYMVKWACMVIFSSIEHVEAEDKKITKPSQLKSTEVN